VLALDGVVAFDLAVPSAVFGGSVLRDAAPPWRRDAGGGAAAPGASYDVRVCAASARARGPRRVRTADGFALDAPHGLDAVAWADTVVVPGLAPPDADVPARALAALRAAHARGARVVSICTGAFVLAAAGLLDGRRATTHWSAAARLAAEYPRVAVDADVLYVDDGLVCTSAGVAAGIDLCLHLVRRDYGAEAANAIARGMVVAPHRSGGQAQFAEAPVPAADDGSLERTRRWMLAHLSEPLTGDALARHAGVSPRTFARRFAAETGTTPLQWLLAQRVLLARRLLETTDEPVARVAALAGFGDALSLRKHFGRATGAAPLAYRRAFRGPAVRDAVRAAA
jgi:transcriptional regulator GlxA family with amidase domain